MEGHGQVLGGNFETKGMDVERASGRERHRVAMRELGLDAHGVSRAQSSRCTISYPERVTNST
jgi:hypothetical protein